MNHPRAGNPGIIISTELSSENTEKRIFHKRMGHLLDYMHFARDGDMESCGSLTDLTKYLIPTY